MKRLNNLYNNIIDIKVIQDMYDKRIKINTKNKKKIERFENNYVSNMIYIKNILKERKYVPGKYNIFLIKEPKIRLIMSQNIIDKIINHVVSKYFLSEVYDKTLIDTNVATRLNKGTNYGIKMLKRYINEIKEEKFYVLKFDISKYFYNIDHDILKKLIRKKIKDKDVLKILDDIINSTNYEYVNKIINCIKEKEINKIKNSNSNYKDKIIKEINNLPIYKKGKGLPIGNMSSQVLAIIYLNELDHFIKEKLKIKYYIRYMDDGIILHKDKEYLKYCLSEIKKILYKYKLELNNKTKIYKSSEGFEFLGFRYYIRNNKLIMKVNNKTKKRFKRKMKIMIKLVNNKKIEVDKFNQVKSSYLGHLNYGNTKKLVRLNIGIKSYDLNTMEYVI